MCDPSAVVAVLVTAIHVISWNDARGKPAHDEASNSTRAKTLARCCLGETQSSHLSIMQFAGIGVKTLQEVRVTDARYFSRVQPVNTASPCQGESRSSGA